MSSSKKASKPAPQEANYQVSDIVLAKLRGYPPWPAMIVDPDKVTKAVKREKPPSKKTTFYCVRFFPAGDHSWAVAKDLSRLYPHEIEAYINEPSKKSGELKRGYEVALNPKEWEENLKREQEEIDRAMEEQEETVDQLDSDGGEDEMDDGEDSEGNKKKKKTPGKKRKRDSTAATSTAGPVEEKQKKKRKSTAEATRRPIAPGGKKSKSKALSAEHVESEDEKSSEKADEPSSAENGDVKKSPAAKPRSSRKDKGSKAAADERPSKRSRKEQEEADDPEDAALAKDPEALRVKEWRHKLQRAFLTTKTPPVASDMPVSDKIFSAVENYDKLTIQYLSFSKIGKVMRRIASMDDIPRDEEFHFKERANRLVTQWQAIIQQENAEKPSENGEMNGMHVEEPSAPPPVSTNGAKPTSSTKPKSTSTTEKKTVNATGPEPAVAVEGIKTNGAITQEQNQDEADKMDLSDS